MEIIQPLEIRRDGQPTGLYHYTSTTGRGLTTPIGYCAGGCPGHPTPAEALDHYRDWQRDFATLDAALLDDWTGCKVPGCDAPTKGGAYLRGSAPPVALCDAHRNRDGLAAALRRKG